MVSRFKRHIGSLGEPLEAPDRLIDRLKCADPHPAKEPDMPVLSVQMLSGRTPEKKTEYIKALAETTVRVLGVPEHAVTIVVTEVDPTHWGTGLRTMAEVRAEKSGS